MSKQKKRDSVESPIRIPHSTLGSQLSTPQEVFSSVDNIDIVVPVYNNLSLLSTAVETARQYAGPRLGRFIFVDDGSVEPVRDFCLKNGEYFRSAVNQGFAPTCNRGAKRTKGRYFVLLNSDTVATNNWLDPMIEMMESDEKLAVVGPLLRFIEGSKDPARPAGRVQSCGFAINANALPYHRFSGWAPDHPRVRVSRDDLQGITGACWLVRRSIWVELGGFEESYGSYFEDIDFCIRAKSKGYKIGYCSQSVLFHHVQASQILKHQLTGSDDPGIQRQALLFVERTRGQVRYDEWLLL